MRQRSMGHARALAHAAELDIPASPNLVSVWRAEAAADERSLGPEILSEFIVRSAARLEHRKMPVHGDERQRERMSAIPPKFVRILAATGAAECPPLIVWRWARRASRWSHWRAIAYRLTRMGEHRETDENVSRC